MKLKVCFLEVELGFAEFIFYFVELPMVRFVFEPLGLFLQVTVFLV
jgi:hypothetical protein